MFIPLPRIILIPYRVIRSIFQANRENEKSDKDSRLAKWLATPEESLEEKDYQNDTVRKLQAAISAKRLVFLRYEGKEGSADRTVIPKKLFRRGQNIYLEAFCETKDEYRRFRIDKIKHMRVGRESTLEDKKEPRGQNS